MIRLREIKISIENDNIMNLLMIVSSKLNIKKDLIKKYYINKKSLDARKKPKLFYNYEIDIEVDNEQKIIKKVHDKNILLVEKDKKEEIKMGNKKLKNRPIIVGSGPAGLFCAYFLARKNYKPLIIERGEDIDNRVKSVEKFFQKNILNKNSNIQFGEGGAGTFSDGKLNTLIKDKDGFIKEVLEIFVKHGAPQEILYEAKPHIGTDILRKVVKEIRKDIINMGGEFRFNTTMTNIILENNNLKKIEVNNSELIDCEVLVLALGHSARDTFRMLYKKKLDIINKPFAVGIRIEHPRIMIDSSQYGKENVGKVPPASYKLTYKSKNGRGVYTFCMCPGGYVINSSSEDKRLVINGMSNYKRDSKNSNSAVIVTVSENDYGSKPLAGIKYQEILEEKAYLEGKGQIPISLYKDFKDKTVSKDFKEVEPIFKSSYKFSNLHNILSEEITSSLIEAIDYFGTKIKGFNRDDAIISAIESRTSSPVRIIRNENLESNIKGIYPSGEGAGYAGGITSSAIDGIKVANKIIEKYANY